jgi:hypothetical protein
MLLDGGREETTREPAFQEVLEVDVINATYRVEVKLRVHKVSSPEKGLGRLKPSLLDARMFTTP